jgi:hypothetical protein
MVELHPPAVAIVLLPSSRRGGAEAELVQRCIRSCPLKRRAAGNLEREKPFQSAL